MGVKKTPCSLCDWLTLWGSATPLSSWRIFFTGSLLLSVFADNWSCQKFYADLLILENSGKHPWLHESWVSLGTVPVSTVIVLGGGIPGNSISLTSLLQAWRGSLAIMMHWNCALRHHFWRKLSFHFTNASCWWTGWGWKMLRPEGAFQWWEQDWRSSQPWAPGASGMALGLEGWTEQRGESEGDRPWGLQMPEGDHSAGIGWKPKQINPAFCIIPWLLGVFVTGLQGERTNQRLSQPSQFILKQSGFVRSIEFPRFHWIHLKGWGEVKRYLDLFSGYSKLWDM